MVAIAAALAIAGVAYGYVRVTWEGRTLFRSSGVWRPIFLILVAAAMTRTSGRVSRLVVALAVFSMMPLPAYRGQLERLPLGKHPIRSAAECVQRVQAASAPGAGLFVDVPEAIWHPLYYYFRRIQPWTLAAAPLDPAIDRHLHDPASARPVFISDRVYRQYAQARSDSGGATGAAGPPMVSFMNSLLLLPGPYGVCSSEAALTSH